MLYKMAFSFKVADLRHLFEKRLKDLGIKKKVNKVHFIDHILSYFHEVLIQNDGKTISLFFSKECRY